MELPAVTLPIITGNVTELAVPPASVPRRPKRLILLEPVMVFPPWYTDLTATPKGAGVMFPPIVNVPTQLIP